MAQLDPATLRAVAGLWRRTGRTLRAVLRGRSMRPTLEDGAEVEIHCGEAIEVGDVVAFVEGSRLFVHRVVARGPVGFALLCCGDARHVPDRPVLDSEVLIGRVVGERRGGVLAPLPPGRPSLRPAVAVCAWLVRRGHTGAVTWIVRARRRLLLELDRSNAGWVADPSAS